MKQAIILRSDLNMGKGKAAAQACHASLSSALKTDKKVMQDWISEGQKKVVLKISGKKELIKIFEIAKQKTVAILIKDAGLTQLTPGECTAVGIGPADDEVIDEIVGELKLF